MHIAIVSDTYIPLRTSGAIQLRDLSIEFIRQGHEVTIFVASPDIDDDWRIEKIRGVRVVRLKSPKAKDVNYVMRTIAEFLMPFYMAINLRKTPLFKEKWDGVVWYSPSIFLAPFAKKLINSSKCRGYLIIRDIFPEWAFDMGLMGKGLPYKFFKAIANYQYSVADVIGVQTAGNLEYFKVPTLSRNFRVEVLQNWLAVEPNIGCSINISTSKLSGRKIFVYAGNMGVAQGMDIILSLAKRLKERSDLGFIFVGRGKEAQRLCNTALELDLNNVIFFDEVDPNEIPGLYSQCHIGLVALDPRHKTHNIPGKFLSYMQAGLPVLASINQGNDLVKLISDERVGRVVTDYLVDSLEQGALSLLSQIETDVKLSEKCRLLGLKLYSTEVAASQVIRGLKS